MRMNGGRLDGVRSWLTRRRAHGADGTALARRNLRQIQDATLRYRFNGVACLKNPFDLALYMNLLSEQRPATIVEIGSASGGSALWFAAQGRGLGLDCRVYSLDINPVTDVSDPDVTFLAGDVHRLDESDLSTLLAACPRPLLVIEDGPHTHEACLAALRFFDTHLRPGEYIVIEDGIVQALGYTTYDNGPNRAVAEFLADAGGRYVVDRDYCDFYGFNVTWNTNGYLRRVGDPAVGGPPPDGT